MRTPIPKQATIRKHIETTNSILRPKSYYETDNTSISETSDNQEVNADHEESLYTFKNSLSITVTDNESDTGNYIYF